MNKQFFKETLGFGLLLWLVGYVLGIVFFFFLPSSVIGWVIMPIGSALTIWVAYKLVKSDFLQHYVPIAIIWTTLAIVLDYFLLVQAFHPTDGYYKIDVYLYYIFTFIIPLGVGWWKQTTMKTK